MRYAFGLIVLFFVLSARDTYGQPAAVDGSSKMRDRVLTNLQFEATMNDVTDANLSLDDGWIFTADSPERKEVKEGERCEGVGIAGEKKEFLRFQKKTKPVLLYKAAETMAMKPRENWQGTVSFWLRVEPSELPEGYVDPFIVTQRAWNDAAFFVDFDKTTPRTFRLGAFSDLKHWNPEGTEWEKVPAEKRPMVVVKELPFSKTKWTHVCFTFKGVNANPAAKGAASLYLDGKLQGTIERDFKFTWSESDDQKRFPSAMMGIGYVGDFDQLMHFDRALGQDEVVWLKESYGRK